jgi:hypothetical protein
MSETSALANWTPEQIAEGKRWVRTWADAGAALEQLRREELRRTNTVEALQRLAGGFESARYLGQARQISGLVEQQAIFAKCRPNLHG